MEYQHHSSEKKDVDASLDETYMSDASKTCDPTLARQGIELDQDVSNKSTCR